MRHNKSIANCPKWSEKFPLKRTPIRETGLFYEIDDLRQIRNKHMKLL